MIRFLLLKGFSFKNFNSNGALFVHNFVTVGQSNVLTIDCWIITKLNECFSEVVIYEIQKIKCIADFVMGTRRCISFWLIAKDLIDSTSNNDKYMRILQFSSVNLNRNLNMH